VGVIRLAHPVRDVKWLLQTVRKSVVPATAATEGSIARSRVAITKSFTPIWPPVRLRCCP
jgi:hypothetical protein